MLKRWLKYARARAAAKGQAPAGAHEHVQKPELPVRGWWQRWTRNLDALEARLNPEAAATRARFRRKQSAKAIMERDARRRAKGTGDESLD
jgi:hypothetical protein